MTTLDEILQVALRLSEDDRELLAERILASLPGELDATTDEEFRQELGRRMADYRESRYPGRPWTDVREEMLKELDNDE